MTDETKRKEFDCVKTMLFPASRRFQTVPSRIAAARLALMPGGRQRRAPPTAGGG